MRSVECGPNKRQRYTVSETPAGQGPPHWRRDDNFFNSKSSFPVNMLVQNFDLYSSETISPNKVCFIQGGFFYWSAQFSVPK